MTGSSVGTGGAAWVRSGAFGASAGGCENCDSIGLTGCAGATTGAVAGAWGCDTGP
ncbi:hypothetical protein PssvBMR6_gp39c [Pseudomonas phage MR6]|uniref:Uncharacterized protein n=1 Tax=Pseudomonas phage MR5 TaxID=2711172 RepID=A0A6M3TCR3_9CAUD|nr:hypothetical protein PssvBMR5_gp39c [Pseudomonas phage MR5]QJD54867.1 hypothetical protein PssvBMR6_gp39c [Pseudomonas phage MR6]QJD54927.1 hypothetical protein PssvBMR7_gp40c [Pseudomonas phage MR7]